MATAKPAPGGAAERRGRGKPAQNAQASSDRAAPEVADSLAPRLVLVAPPSGATLAGAAVPPALAAVPVSPAPSLPARPARQQRLGQASLLPPLSTNGWRNARTVNRFSLNAVAGYASGVRAVELGGLLNVVRDTVRGFQAAGLLNLTGTETRGVQLAGLANVGGGSVRGLQAAGLANVTRDDVRGLQLAGLLNLTGGAARARRDPARPTRVRRWLGLPRLLATDPGAALLAAPSDNQPGLLLQAATLANLTGTDVRGLQTATALNVARQVRGVQFGLVNVAKRVRGVQFGLVNVADSVDGVALGLINIVRHGYLRGEVWASETLPLNVAVKLGVRRYYTILGVAAQPFGSRLQWAGGFGIGTAGRPHGRFALSLDVVQWTLGNYAAVGTDALDANLLTQFRPALAWQIEREGHLQLVLAPTLNLALAFNGGASATDFGGNQWLWIDRTGVDSQTRLWPGFQIGLRF